MEHQKNIMVPAHPEQVIAGRENEAALPLFEMDCEHTETVMQFLANIGLAVHALAGAKGFCQYIEIRDGALYVDQQCPASTLLHEAGHLAVMPSRYRHLMNGDLFASFETIFDDAEIRYDSEPEHPTNIALIQASDPEATAWAWAAGTHLKLPHEHIIQNHEYSNEGAHIRLGLGINRYIGINGMANAGFCVTKANPYRPLPVYPTLAFWLQH